MIIAEGGSTKMDIVILDKDGRKDLSLTGVNPYYQTEDEMFSSLSASPLGEMKGQEVTKEVYYYGAGCTFDKSPILENVMKRLLDAERVEVKSDMLAAARGTLGNESGICGILGTGSNSCYYDGKAIVKSVSSLGFYLGDEGSGADLGKRLVSDVLKGIASPSMTDLFFKTFETSQQEIMERVYHGAYPNRYLASFVSFLAENREDSYINNIVTSAFRDFFKRNIDQYDDCGTKDISFVGGVASEFAKEVSYVAAQYGFRVRSIVRSPLEGLVEYHKTT